MAHDDPLPMAGVIAHDGEVLDACIKLIKGKAGFDLWPEEPKQAFLGALWDAGLGSRREEQKARDMRRHLFRGHAPLVGDATFARTRTAERVRADLMGCVPLGAGIYLARTAMTDRKIAS